MNITPNDLRLFAEHLKNEGKAPHTVLVYTNKADKFAQYAGDSEITPHLLEAYRGDILSRYNTPRTQNTNVSVTNIFLHFLGSAHFMTPVECDHYKLYSKKTALSADELKKLLACADGRLERAGLLAEVFARTGIRTGELAYLTVDALERGYFVTTWRNITRKVILSSALLEHLTHYVNEQHIDGGPILVTRTGRAMNQRDAYWLLKALADAAGIDRNKVNPMTLRQLFAKTYFDKFGDLTGLTDLLGIKEIEQAALYVTREHG
ncbi:MAG: tyrosine-type recombinase/integrase [Peptococcaceae bacterium]|jgi:site-specific recombinase XerD|nr:tyrosine-type recombinase/integrase [Peptococcaceae bacterium]